jgi:hypothetical protein
MIENRELIYDLAKKLDFIIEVKKKGEYLGKYKFINNKLHKLKEDEKLNDHSKEKEVR